MRGKCPPGNMPWGNVRIPSLDQLLKFTPTEPITAQLTLAASVAMAITAGGLLLQLMMIHVLLDKHCTTETVITVVTVDWPRTGDGQRLVTSWHDVYQSFYHVTHVALTTTVHKNHQFLEDYKPSLACGVRTHDPPTVMSGTADCMMTDKLRKQNDCGPRTFPLQTLCALFFFSFSFPIIFVSRAEKTHLVGS